MVKDKGRYVLMSVVFQPTSQRIAQGIQNLLQLARFIFEKFQSEIRGSIFHHDVRFVVFLLDSIKLIWDLHQIKSIGVLNFFEISKPVALKP